MLWAWRGLAAVALLAVGLVGPGASHGGISNTRHNLSKNGPGTVKATDETQICVFCHTPHAANTAVNAPLWNRTVSTTGYTRYTSASMDADYLGLYNDQPGGSSILCLSCHDGTIALGSVKVLGGVERSTPIAGLESTMPPGTFGATSGYTRLLGKDLRNDHPISITYNDNLATSDGEMAFPGSNTTLMGLRSKGNKPTLPFEATGTSGEAQMQCATCHDPHLEDANDKNRKFLRLNRLQKDGPTGGDFSKANDIICLACHTKGGEAWSQSAHANKSIATHLYKADPAELRGFTGTPAVWEVACLNCHDTHTAAGSRRLLREGVGVAATITAGYAAGTTIPASTWTSWSGTRYQPGSATTGAYNTVSSIESTCLQCHTTSGKTILQTAPPDIETDFFTKTYRMPLTAWEQGGASKSERHEIRNANFVECRKSLGNTSGTEPNQDHLTAEQKTACGDVVASNDNRHVECTDCHNPHRVRRNSKFYGNASLGNANRRIHDVGGPDGNVASGVLRGAWGVEPSYTSDNQTTVTVSGSGATVTGTKWPETPDFTVKFGDPGGLSSTARTQPYLTREYQLCFKCHSNYAMDSFPALGNTGGGTKSAQANNLANYTNVAAEFAVRATDPPTTGTDQGERGNAGTACAGSTDCEPSGSYPRGINSGSGEVNHRSWHPVLFPTGRDRKERAMAATGAINLRAPFAANIGKNTMHCSDCHGADSSWTVDSGPNTGVTQGPHGSNNPFILRGTWSIDTTLSTLSTGHLCGNCHSPRDSSGFRGTNSRGTWMDDHWPDDNMGVEACMRCHIAVPHGWKNKAFLANLRCVGKEVAGSSGDCVARPGTTYDKAVAAVYAPYYNGAQLRISTWMKSGSWTYDACGSDMDKCQR